MDTQVKLRGYRIELGEIEQTLAGHGDVRSCVVAAREDTPGNKQLVAYVVPSRAGNAEVLPAYLKERLPQYMVPAHFVFLDALPLTRNGKVDRGALPAPSGAEVAATRRYDAPRTPTEAALAEIWRAVLELERIGIHEDLFELGAHSLLAMRAVMRIRERFEVDVPLRRLFEHPTVAGLAQLIDRLAWVAGETPLEPAAGREQIVL